MHVKLSLFGGRFFLFAIGAALFKIELLCLPAIEVLLRCNFPVVSKKDSTVSTIIQL